MRGLCWRRFQASARATWRWSGRTQRELSAAEVAAFAELLGVTEAEVAARAGVSTPVPGADPLSRIAELERRVATLEAELARLKG